MIRVSEYNTIGEEVINFWFMDNWHSGTEHTFYSLQDAEAAAKKQMGAVTIFKNTGEVIKTVDGGAYFA